MQIKLTEAAKNKVVGFAGRALPLSLRSPQDLEKLAIIARESNDNSILTLFESLPSLEELRGAKVEMELPVLPNAPAMNPPDETIPVKRKKSRKQ